MINVVWLRTFCTLVEVGHFTHTAERLHMTQPGVSQHVHKLEAQLGVDLLVREGKRFSLSEAGERLYDHGQAILGSLSNLEQVVSDDPPYTGTVRVMSPGSVGLKLYPQLLALQSEHPGLVMDYRFAPNADVEAAVARQAADIGLMTSKPVSAEVVSQPIAWESLLLVTPASVTDPNWEALMALGFIDHPDGSHHADLLLGANYPEFQHSQLFPKKGFSNQIGLILEPVSLGLGFTVLPAHAVEAFPKPEAICAYPLDHPVSETLYLCTRRDKPLPKRVEMVIARMPRWL
ncbi:LysR family transcriptional regulator [Marinobacter persicus]|uniref:LysR family transcriptional regulator n=1 Tax=Marinobacter persicus TaxID=930118 RepID=A0A2S6G8M5_9GAMM|nr:LysR family transcriptional regulator [Marinobacter persicus]PPK52456.1 LysR family transcriptional regulator [Marinobacter persicus]PPK55428.1 LysR family transcriptional regulator [Marinobacter persicus]PPK57901.1 LysR family transcriptional regulator [Marinobacter persicus]